MKRDEVIEEAYTMLSLNQEESNLDHIVADFAIHHAAAETERADKADAELLEIKDWMNRLERAEWEGGQLLAYEPPAEIYRQGKSGHWDSETSPTPYEAIQAYLKGGKRC